MEHSTDKEKLDFLLQALGDLTRAVETQGEMIEMMADTLEDKGIMPRTTEVD